MSSWITDEKSFRPSPWRLASMYRSCVRFSTPRVQGDRAFVEYWARSLDLSGEPTTLAGCAIARLDADGLVVEARDYWHLELGHHEPPPDWGR